jgi:hypothetical protein
MKKGFFAFAMSLALPLAGWAVDGNAQEPRTISLIDAARCATPLVIDGKLDDPCWQNQPAISAMVLRDARERTPASLGTRTVVLYDDQAIYIGMRMEEPNVKGIKAVHQSPDETLWADDSVEIHLGPGEDRKSYYKLTINSLGTCLGNAGRDEGPLFTLSRWSVDFQERIRAFVGPDYWSVECRFPWSDLRVTAPRAGDIWMFEVSRFRWADPSAKSEFDSWNRGAQYNHPEVFGDIVFSGTGHQRDLPWARKLLRRYGGMEVLRMYEPEGETRIDRAGNVLFRDYPTLMREQTGRIASDLEQFRKTMAASASGWQPVDRERTQARLKEMEARLQSLREQPPGAVAVEALDRLKDRCDQIKWTFRYLELATTTR